MRVVSTNSILVKADDDILFITKVTFCTENCCVISYVWGLVDFILVKETFGDINIENGT